MTRLQLAASALAAFVVAVVPWPSFWNWNANVMTKDSTNPAEQFAVTKTDGEWRASLTPRQYAVLRRHDTEYPGTNPLLGEHRAGVFRCAACGQPLFLSGTKFESGTGWPTFYAAVEGAVGTKLDTTLAMTRIEIYCSRCGGHLGHLFPDGPRPTGQRYCTKGAALAFEPGGTDQ
jgi:peptide-methionine (R)-S-oxide reductase